MSHMTPHSTVNIHGPPSAGRVRMRPVRRAAVILGTVAVLGGTAAAPALLPASAVAAEAAATTTNSTQNATASSIKADTAEREAALQRLRNDGMLDEGEVSAVQQSQLTSALAKEFGTKFIGGAFSSGGGMALTAVLAAMGYEEDSELTDALGEIRASLATLEADVQEIKQQLERLLDGLDRQNFYNSYIQAGLAGADIDTAMRSVAMWVERDLTPSAKNVSDMQTVIKTAIGQVDFMTTDPLTGTVPLMMKATGPGSVVDVGEYYAQIDEARDHYRTVFAQGLATLDMLLAWDTDGTIASDIEVFTAEAVESVHDLYRFGVEPLGPVEGDWRSNLQSLDQPVIDVKGTGMMLSQWAPGTFRSQYTDWEARNRLFRGNFQGVFTTLASGYDPANYGGVTLQRFLQQRGLPTAYVYNNGYHHNETRGGFNAVGQRDVNVMPRADIAYFEDNSLHETWVDLDSSRRSWRESCAWWGAAGTCSPHNGDDRSGKTDVMNWVSTRHANARAAAANPNSTWTPPDANRWRDATSLLLVAPVTDTNAGGWATDFDEKRIEEAAFGDD